MTSENAQTRVVDLTSLPADGEVLRAFYESLYVAEFPDPDERESLANMLAYLAADGSFGNAYLATVAFDGERIIGGSIADYFVRSSCGAIEFLVVDEAHRGRGLGSRLSLHTEARMSAAANARAKSLQMVLAEMNDPFRRSDVPDNLDPARRLGFWDRLGYRRAAFPYVQPALSEEQGPVLNLLLGAKPIDPSLTLAVPAALIEAFLRDYLIYAMRIDVPERSPEFVEMARYLAGHPSIPLESLAAYVANAG